MRVVWEEGLWRRAALVGRLRTFGHCDDVQHAVCRLSPVRDVVGIRARAQVGEPRRALHHAIDAVSVLEDGAVAALAEAEDVVRDGQPVDGERGGWIQREGRRGDERGRCEVRTRVRTLRGGERGGERTSRPLRSTRTCRGWQRFAARACTIQGAGRGES